MKTKKELERLYLEVKNERDNIFKRLRAIQFIIERAENSAMAVDGPVDETINHMNDSDIRNIWIIASGFKNKEKDVRCKIQ